MLIIEIILLIVLTSSIARIVEKKGYRSGGYKLKLILYWFGGEIIGALIGYLIFIDRSLEPRFSSGFIFLNWILVYVFSFACAVIGGAIYFRMASGLPLNRDKVWEDGYAIEDPGKMWECPKCREKNLNTSFVCRKCGFRLV